MTEQLHEPETKGTNKTRDLQDAIIRARRLGYGDPLSVANHIYGWFMEASRDVQISVLDYAISHHWNNTTDKMEGRSSGGSRRSSYTSSNLSELQKKKIDDEVRADLDRQWLDIIMPMTFAQVRAAKLLPDDMVAKGKDDERVGDVFTAEELREVNKKNSL